MQEIDVSTEEKRSIVDITPKIQDCVSASSVEEGICIVYCPHTTAGIFVNENYDLDVKKDILKTYEKLVPPNDEYVHSEGNSDAHIIASLMGNTQTIIIQKGSLLLGQWQGVFFFEGDGPRKRVLYIKIMEG